MPTGCRNSPQRCPYGLHAEQLSGTAFTAPRADNHRSWLYRIRPSAMHLPFQRIDANRIISSCDSLQMPEVPTDFVEGIVTMAGSGTPIAR